MPIDQTKLAAWQAEVAQQFEAEIKVHFAAEEQLVFPAAQTFSELNPLIEDLLADHQWLRACFAKAEARQSSQEELLAFARRLSQHVRKEERQLFERLQEFMPKEELSKLGTQLDRALESASQVCSLPNPTK
jgi:hemerythrin-like domain-containing protein